MTADRVELVLDFKFGVYEDTDCTLCGQSIYENGSVGIAVLDGGRVCESCTQQHAPGIGLYDIAQALDRLDTALAVSPRTAAPFIVANFLRGVDELLERRGLS